MPPQNNSQMSSSSGSGFNPESLAKNPKFITTLKIFAVYMPVLTIVSYVVGIVTSGLKYSFTIGLFSVPTLILTIISGVISGTVNGIVFYFAYDPIHNWVKRSSFLSKYIYNMFTLLWIPSLVALIVFGVFSLLGLMSIGAISTMAGAYGITANAGGIFFGIIISFIVYLVVYYFCAKKISTKLEPMYPW